MNEGTYFIFGMVCGSTIVMMLWWYSEYKYIKQKKLELKDSNWRMMFKKS